MDVSRKLVEAMFTKDPKLREAAEKAGLFSEGKPTEESDETEVGKAGKKTEEVRKTDKVRKTKEGKKTDKVKKTEVGKKTEASEITGGVVKTKGVVKVEKSEETEGVVKTKGVVEMEEVEKMEEVKKKEERKTTEVVEKNEEVAAAEDVEDSPLEIEVNEDISKPHFERCYARIVRSLKEKAQSLPTGDEFRKLDSDVERYKFIREMGVTNQVKDLDKNREMKSYDNALKRRETGNGMFKKRYYADSHELYTQSIQLFPKELDNEMRSELAKSFANRATTACHMNEFRACLIDIQRAFDHGYPDNLKHKLYEKQGKCYKHFKDYDKAVEALKNSIQILECQEMAKDKKNNIMIDLKKQLSNCESLARDAGSDPQTERESPIPQLSKTGHENLRNASSLVDVVHNDVIGRHGVAKQDVHVGDVIVVEKPFSSVLLPPFYDTHCYSCFRRVKAPLPCDHCTTVRYCDSTCRDRAWSEYHQVECGMLHYIDSTDNCWGHLAYRTLVKLGHDKLLQLRKELTEATTKWSEYGANGESVNSDDYKCIHALVTHAEDRDGADLFFRAVKAAYLLKCLQKKRFFPEKTSSDILDLAGGLLLSNLQLCPCNAHEISELQVQKSDLQKTKSSEIGAGLYPTLSLLNHSCDPNVVRYFYGDVCVTRAIHHIKKGEEIVDNYGSLYPTQKLADRQKHLKNQYFFECKCKPCTQDWPLYEDLASGEDAPPVLKCEKCGDALMPEKDGGLDDWPCVSCSHPHNILQRMGALDQSHDRFAIAIEAVLKGDSTAVRALEEHLDLMDRLLYLPWKMFNNAQEALKHNYGVSANCFTLP